MHTTSHDFRSSSGSAAPAVASGDIAVIGMACRFPGAADYHAFWRNLCEGRVSTGEIPAGRWDWREHFGDAQEANKSHSKWGGFIDGVDQFDAPFFGISPREAHSIDPQQRIVLELAWQCVEDAGQLPASLSGRNIGVYIGACNFDYKTLQETRGHQVEGHSATGNANTIIPNRVSYFLNLHGPSIAVDTACSSSLVALQQAVAALRAGECEGALVGGVSVLATPDRFISFSQVGMLSPTGSCKSFDAAADGYARGEGAGLLYLKPLAQALADGDRIHGVIKGVAVNHGGRARSLTAPSALAQSKVIGAAMRQARIAPSSIGYIEAHGTGTPLGDPIEIHGMTRAFEQAAARLGESLATGYCAVGAVKTNIGHLESAAGVAGVIKALLALKHRALPPSAHFNTLNPRIKLEHSPFYMLDRLRPWVAPAGSLLRAGVSSFGFGGVNSHVILEQAPAPASVAVEAAPGQAHLLTLSAFCEASLRMMAGAYALGLRQDGATLAALCRASQLRVTCMDARLALTAVCAEAMAEALEAFADDGRLMPGVSAAHGANAPRIGFLFAGQGAQYVGMGRALYATQPVFRAAMQRCDTLLEGHLGGSLIEQVFDGAAASLDRTRLTQPALFALEYALVQLWKSVGVAPAAVIGHSLGEIVAACVAGVFTLEDALSLVAQRADLMDALPADGAMAAVQLPEAEVRALLTRHTLHVDIAAVNGPAATVISGPLALIERALTLFSQEGAQARTLAVSHAFHSHMMEGMQSAFFERIGGLAFSVPGLPLLSNVSGALAGAEVAAPRYWVDHVRKPVLFQDGIAAMNALGMDLMLEVGPAPVLTGMVRRTLGEGVPCVASLRPDHAADAQFLAALGELFVRGAPVRLAALGGGAPAPWIDLPPYPFSGQRYWIAPAAGRTIAAAGLLAPAVTALPGARLALALDGVACYVADADAPQLAYLSEHRVRGAAIMPGAAYLAMALEAGALRERVPRLLVDVKLLRALPLRAGLMLQTLHSAHDGAVRMLSRCCAEDGEQAPWTLHASATILPGTSGARVASMPDPGAGEALDVAALYQRMHAAGLEYGPAFRAIGTARMNGGQVLATIALPAGIAAGGAAAHPAMLDAIFQSVFPLLPADAFEHGLLPLPSTLEMMWLDGALPATIHATARLASSDAAAGIYSCEFDLFDTAGRAIGSIAGLTLRRMALPGRAAVAGAGCDFLYQPGWRPAPETPQTDADQPGQVLLVYSAHTAPLGDAIAARFDPARVIHVGIDLGDAHPTDRYHAHDIDEPAGLATVLAEHPGIGTVYFLGALHYPATNLRDIAGHADMTVLDGTQEQGVVTLFHLIKSIPPALLAERKLTFKVLCNRSYAVQDGEQLVPWGAGSHGLASVFCSENENVSLVNIDLDLEHAADDLEWTSRKVCAEPASDAGHAVAYRAHGRFLRHIAPVAPVAPAPAAEQAYRERGVYLIVGGASGIGLALSRQLAGAWKARLAWFGRRTPDAAMLAAMDELRASGAEVTYYQVDICDPNAVQVAVSAVRKRYGAIHGVVHSALVLRDQLLVNMDLAALREGMDPKIRGTWALCKAIRSLELDFLMFFSSGVSFFPNRGQANYVAGCVFQDAYAHFLRRQHGLPVRIVNWGRWGGVGAAATDAYSKRLAASGFHAIEAAEGLAAIGAIVSGSLVQVIPIKAEQRALALMGVDFGAAPPAAAVRAARVSAADVMALDLAGAPALAQERLLAFLRDELSEVLHLGEAGLASTGRPLPELFLSELGVDSLTAMDLRNRLRKQFSVDISVEILLGGARIQAVLEAIYEQLLVRQLMQGAPAHAAADAANDNNDEGMETLVL